MNKNNKNDTNFLYLTSQQASYVTAGFFLVVFFSFTLGFYWGKKNSKKPITDQLDISGIQHVNLNNKQVCDNKSVAQMNDGQQEEYELEVNESQNLTNSKNNNDNDDDVYYYSELVGFGTLKAAKKCENELLNQFNVCTIERIGKTVDGDTRKWYQVIYCPEKDKSRLIAEIDQIKKIAKIKDIKISEVDDHRKIKLLEKVV